MTVGLDNWFESSLQRRGPEKEEAGALQKMHAETQPAAPLTPGTLATKHGLQVKKDGDEFVIWTHYGGKDVEFARTTREPERLKQAEATIAKLEKEKREELEKKYGVAFSTNGEEVETQIASLDKCGQFIKNNHMIHARAPMLPELLGVEAALASGVPSHRSTDEKTGVKFYYLTEKFLATDGADTLANYMHKDKDGRPAVYFWPESSAGRLITEEDIKKWGTFSENSIESLTEHELGHNTQRRLKWDDSDKLMKALGDMGWHVHQPPGTCEVIWMIRGKKEDEFYRLGEDGFAWVACNKEGGFLSNDGKVVAAEKDAAQFTADEVRELARIKPATPYFDNFVEMDADALMMFRSSSDRRQLLFKNGRDFYQFVKTQDQADIDATYGKDKQGNSRQIRLPDGNVVANTAANRALVEAFEK